MVFNYDRFTEENFKEMVSWKAEQADGVYHGAIHVGDITIDIITRDYEGDGNIVCDLDFYVLGEDTGYGYTSEGFPYDYAEGLCIAEFRDMTYEQFKAAAEENIRGYIKEEDELNIGYSLQEHAERETIIWSGC